MEKMQESMKNTFKDILSGNISPRTIQTKLKENISNLTQRGVPINNAMNIGESVPEVMESVPEVMESVPGNQTSNFSKWSIFKIILAILIIGLLAMNAYTYVTYGKDAFTYFLIDDDSVKDGNIKNIEPSKVLNEVSDDKATTAIHSSIDIEAEKLSQNEKVDESDIEKALKKNNKKSYKANNLSNNVNKKVGYCYIGSDRNVRTCVKVGEKDTCISGEVFPTRDLCINPTLKE
jgi:hypothetical protein